MADLPDPPVPLPKPVVAVLAAGTRVWRVHGLRSPLQPNPTPRPHPRVGGRFDRITGEYAYVYVGDSPHAAVAETLCRNLPVDRSPRIIPHRTIVDRQLTDLTTSSSLGMADLTGAGTARINAGSWLTHCDPAGYLHTRRWAAAIFAAHPDLDGLQYRPRPDDNRIAWILKTAPDIEEHPALTAGESLDLNTPAGRAVLSPILAAHNAAIDN